MRGFVRFSTSNSYTTRDTVTQQQRIVGSLYCVGRKWKFVQFWNRSQNRKWAGDFAEWDNNSNRREDTNFCCLRLSKSADVSHEIFILNVKCGIFGFSHLNFKFTRSWAYDVAVLRFQHLCFYDKKFENIFEIPEISKLIF